MKTILILFALTTLAYSYLVIEKKAGDKDFLLTFHSTKPIAFTRDLRVGGLQTWNLTGPNKGTWVDAKGKKVPSSDFVFVAPNTLKVKKVTKEDYGVYDHLEAPTGEEPPITSFILKVD